MVDNATRLKEHATSVLKVRSLTDLEKEALKTVVELKETIEVWRKLALQFDQHRMESIWWLRALNDGKATKDDVINFLAKPPPDGDEVLANRIKALALDVNK